MNRPNAASNVERSIFQRVFGIIAYKISFSVAASRIRCPRLQWYRMGRRAIVPRANTPAGLRYFALCFAGSIRARQCVWQADAKNIVIAVSKPLYNRRKL